MIEINTPRLILRQWKDEDYKPFARLNADPQVMEYFPSTLNKSASDTMASKCRQLIAERGWGLWALELKETSEFMGFVGLHTPMAELPFTPCVEIGWRLGHAYWGKGFATEAAKAALRVGFTILALEEIVSFTAVQNKRSKAVMQRLGMDYLRTFDHPSLSKDSSLLRHYLYCLTKVKWDRLG